MKRTRWVMVGFLLAGMAAQAQQSCRKVVIAGEVQQGQEFRKAIAAKLAFVLKPTPQGWRIEVQPVPFALAHDAAEVATPPYQSISPLLLTTDYTFRAQDVVSWNPRDFQFATDPAAIAVAAAQEDLVLSSTADLARKKQAEAKLIALAEHAMHGELKLLDADLVPGTADQSASAAAVAAHWRTTPHTLLQPKPGATATAAGSLQRLKFEATLWLPANLPPAAGVHGAVAACPR